MVDIFWHRVRKGKNAIAINQQYAKAEDSRWWLSEYQAVDNSFTFASLDLEIGLNDIYEEIEFS